MLYLRSPWGLFTKSVLDFVAIDEVSVDWVHDDHEGASYLRLWLKGLRCSSYEALRPANRRPTAVLPGVVDWAEDPGDSSPFGAAFAYHSPTWNSLETFFASNEG